MQSRPSTTDRPGQEATDGDKPAPLASAKRLLLTTFNQDGSPQATPVRVLADGDRAYFRTSDTSGVSKRLRHTDWVQAAPCTVLGVCCTGPTVDATARPLADAEASLAAERLVPRYQAWRRFLASLARRVKERRIVYYELRPDEAAEDPAVPPAVTEEAQKRPPVWLVPAGAERPSGRGGHHVRGRLAEVIHQKLALPLVLQLLAY